MKQTTLGLIALALAASPLIAAPVTAAAQPAAAPAGDPVKGQATYTAFLCYACHGSRGSNGNGGPIAGANLFPYPFVLNQLRKPRRQMPAYPAEQLSDQGVADIYAYLKTIPPSPNVKDIPILNR
jgi:mono/diheme cytochrome c family protein